MSFFDFSDAVEQAIYEADDEASRLSAKTAVHREKLPAAVRKAGFRFLSKDGSFARGKHDLVIGVAAWSDPDLAALEDLVVQARPGIVQVTVFDIDDLSYPEMLKLFPGMRRFMRTPVVIQYRDGVLTYFGEGHDAVLWLRQL